MKRVYLYGASGHAAVVASVLRDAGQSIAGYFDDRFPLVMPGGETCLAGRSHAGFVRPEAPLLITIGKNATRKWLAEQLGGPFATAVHPTAVVAGDVTLGEGTVVMQQAIVQTLSRLGRHVIVNTGASIDHENVLGDYVHVSPHATLCGDVQVGEGSWIGAAAVVIQGIRIGAWATIGAGAVVIRDVPDFATVVGNPGRVIKISRDSTIPGETGTAAILEEIRALVNDVLSNSGRSALSTLLPDQQLRDDLGLDSLELAELTVRIEAKYGVDVFRGGVVTQVRDIVKRIGEGGKVGS